MYCFKFFNNIKVFVIYCTTLLLRLVSINTFLAQSEAFFILFVFMPALKNTQPFHIDSFVHMTLCSVCKSLARLGHHDGKVLCATTCLPLKNGSILLSTLLKRTCRFFSFHYLLLDDRQLESTFNKRINLGTDCEADQTLLLFFTR